MPEGFTLSSLNAHYLLAGTDTKIGFKQNISLSQEEQTNLIGVRNTIRVALRRGFSDLSNEPSQKAKLLEKRYMDLAKDGSFRVAPRFRMQGSFSYRTVNHPAWTPPQEIDLDDGVYLPVSFTSQTTPVIAALAFFEAVEKVIHPICDKNNWTMQRKRSCVRIILSAKVHLDLPLYSIPDDDFHDPEIVAKADSMAFDEAMSAEIGLESFQEIPKDRIMLALSNGEWVQSDPRKMENWFQGAVNQHGEHLRRISRYLKAWRDWKWNIPGKGMSSICLMACAVTAFDEAAGDLADNRDDLALKYVAGRLPELLANSISNPVVEGLLLDADWTNEQRDGYVAQARDLKLHLESAMSASSFGTVISMMQKAFGDRIPADKSLLIEDTLETTILSAMPRRVAAPVVPRSTSG
jgi:hypothetical protein